MSAHGTYTTDDDRAAVRFERRLAHPPEAVWAMVTDIGELAHWFPCEVEPFALELGASMAFAFGPDFRFTGEVTELEPLRRFAFLWGVDLIRFDLTPDGEGTRLVMLHVLGSEGAPGAAKTAAGWHLCLDAMERAVDGQPDPGPPTGMSPHWQTRYDEYVAAGMPSGAPIPSS